MPTINLTNNSDLNVTASSADNNATLNRYLRSVLTFKTPPSFDAIANLPVKGQSELGFPITLSATGEGKFALKKTTFDVQLGASASIGLIVDGESDFLSALEIGGDASGFGLVSLAMQAKLSVEDDATAGDFTFGIADSSTVTVTSYHPATADERLVDAVAKAAAALTIPHDLADLESIPADAICRLDGASSLKFTASATYSFLSDPLAAVAIDKLPSLGINAGASATLEGTLTHSSGHVLTIAKLPSGLLHLAVSLNNTDDFETSLTMSSGITAQIGNQDALAFLLGLINPDSAAQADAIAVQMKDAAKFKADIKSAIDQALSTSLGASLKAALDVSKVPNRAFLYEIDLNKLDADSEPALEAALTGDFTGITKAGPPLNGIKELHSALTVTKDFTSTFAVHLLGIFNAASINEFVVKSKIDFTNNTQELVLSDESLQIVENNLAAEKLRKLVLKDITLTLPASANTKDADTPITLAYLDREGSTSPVKFRQFANVLHLIGAPEAAAAASLLDRALDDYGTCSIFLGLNLNPDQCRQLFIDANGKPFGWMHYNSAMCNIEKEIYAGLDRDPENSYHLKLFRASPATWQALRNAGADENKIPILQNLGMSDAEARLATTDVTTAIWWSTAMANYADALLKSASLKAMGEEVVQDSNAGYTEPWMILTAWSLVSRPTIKSDFSCSLQAASAAVE
jgi:hypothetical protein